ncbi:hypothetical protein [endosymbiont 'TC1' of Trimyema compressum]|uniref:hypothetical protein n=1 Tax=endosymbiont 'TC1' of Trimyema compressum TaxID=243899 RepID=UPI001FE1CEE0|nr:hypothetical protein [endosymbiont 'TC1' of Trimyema compressum]
MACKKSGIIVQNQGTFVAMGNLTDPKVFLSIFGVLVITYTIGATNSIWDLGVKIPQSIVSWTPPVEFVWSMFWCYTRFVFS